MPTANEVLTLTSVCLGFAGIYLALRSRSRKRGVTEKPSDAGQPLDAAPGWVTACGELDEEARKLGRLLERLEAEAGGSLFAPLSDTTVVDLDAAPSFVDEVPLSIDERRDRLQAALENESQWADWEQGSPDLVSIIEALQEIPMEVPQAASAIPIEPDDLKEIRGIGKVLEGVLNQKGIHTFRQLASLSLDDIEALSKELKHFANRVHRDRWVEQARELAGLSG